MKFPFFTLRLSHAAPVAVALPLVVAACGSSGSSGSSAAPSAGDSGLAANDDSGEPGDSGTLPDASIDGSSGPEGGPSDAGAHDGGSLDGASADGGGPAPDGGGDFTNIASWASHDFSALLGGSSNGFNGSAFDGRYLYLAPYFSGSFVRVDTQGSFSAASSYTAMAGATIPGFGAFSGAVFDGRYVYYVPSGSIVVRYDTTAPFTAASSYASFDLSTTGAPATIGFSGGTFDGRYVYFAPQGNNSFSGYAVRLDTEGTFTAAASYQAFDMATVDARAVGYAGAVFDGRYVYFSPFAGDAARYDTTAPFGGAAFTFFSIAGGSGATFDGRFITFVPGGILGDVSLLDTQAALDAGTAVSTFDPSQVIGRTQAYHGALFDGRYVYVGSEASGGTTTDPGTVVLRRDTQGAFTDVASWSEFDVGTLSPAAGDFFNLGFDGRYVYFVPWHSAVIARFDTEHAGSVPSTTHGSFF